MPFYVIAYDLHSTDDYSKVHEILGNYTSRRILESVWIIETNEGPVQIREKIRSILTGRDFVFVSEYKSENSAWFLGSASCDWMDKHLPANHD